MGKTKDCCKLFISKYLWDPCSWQNSKMAPMNIALRVTPAVILPKEGWAPKNWCFQTVVLEKTLESPLDCKEIQPVHPEYSLKGLILKLKFQYSGHEMWRANSLEKTLILARGEGGSLWWDVWMESWTQWTRVWANSGRWWRTGKPGVLRFMGLQRVRHDLATEQQMDHLGNTEECLISHCQIGSNPCSRAFFKKILFFNCICQWSQKLFGNRRRQYVQ